MLTYQASVERTLTAFPKDSVLRAERSFPASFHLEHQTPLDQGQILLLRLRGNWNTCVFHHLGLVSLILSQELKSCMESFVLGWRLFRVLTKWGKKEIWQKNPGTKMHNGDAEDEVQQAGNQGKVSLPGLGEPCKPLPLN